MLPHCSKVGDLGSQPRNLHRNPRLETNTECTGCAFHEETLLFCFSFPKLGDALCRALLPQLLCIPPCFSPGNVPFPHSYTSPSNPCSWLVAAPPGLPSTPSPRSLGIPGPSQPISTVLAARSEGALLPFSSRFSPGYFFPSLLIFQSQQCYQQAQAPCHIGSRNTKQEELWDHLSMTPTSPFNRKEKKKVGEIIFPMRFCCSFSYWCPEYRDGFVAPSFHCVCCCSYLGSDPRGSRRGIASNTQGQRGSSQHILINPSVENWKTVPA